MRQREQQIEKERQEEQGKKRVLRQAYGLVDRGDGDEREGEGGSKRLKEYDSWWKRSFGGIGGNGNKRGGNDNRDDDNSDSIDEDEEEANETGGWLDDEFYLLV